MKTPPLPFLDCFHLADCAARVLAECRPLKDPLPDYLTPEQHSNLRTINRASAVKALRYLWQAGDADQRTTVAARVSVWLTRPHHDIALRIRDRETRRLSRRIRRAA
jgi:hypothetical protein